MKKLHVHLTACRHSRSGLFQGNLPERKNNFRARFAGVVVLMNLLCMAMVSCAALKIKNIDPLNEGWVDDDTYQVLAVGVPDSRLINAAARQESSFKNALEKAEMILVEKFLYDRQADDFYEGGVSPAMRKEFISSLKQNIISRKYDAEQNCEVLVSFQRKNFKNDNAARNRDRIRMGY